MSCGKRRFPSEHAAKIALLDIALRRNRGSRAAAKRQECRAYECPSCRGWHLTKKPRWEEVPPDGERAGSSAPGASRADVGDR